MKILMIFQSAPLPPPLDMGSAKRNYPFLRENLKRHEVSVVSFGTEEQEKTFRAEVGHLCKNVHFIRYRSRWYNIMKRIGLILTGHSTFRLFKYREFQRKIDELMDKEDFDLVHCCTAILGFYTYRKGIPIVGDTHNVEYDLFYRIYQESRQFLLKWYSFLVYSLGKRDEIRILSSFDVVLTTTEQDREMFRKDLPDKRIVVIQNGVDQSFFEVLPEVPEPNSIIFMGLMNWYPNKHAVMYFLDEIFPLITAEIPDAKLTILGANPTEDLVARASKNIIVTGFIRDVRPHIARSQVFVIPLLIGSGIRGKALEAMAMKKAIVTTTLGCNGIQLRNGESALFEDSPREFADAVIRCLRDPKLREQLGENAWRSAKEHYQWEAKGRQLQDVYASVSGNVSCKSSESTMAGPAHRPQR
jgi:polysaccharide biosynthesis protein PslH